MNETTRPEAPAAGAGIKKSHSNEAERQVPLRALSAPLRRLLLDTPRAEWYRIKAVRASYQETVDLVLIVNALEHLLKVTPERALQRVMADQVEEGAFYAAYRGVRDEIRSLREKCMALGTISGVTIKAWTDARGRGRHSRPHHGPNGASPGGARPTGDPRGSLPRMEEKSS